MKKTLYFLALLLTCSIMVESAEPSSGSINKNEVSKSVENPIVKEVTGDISKLEVVFEEAFKTYNGGGIFFSGVQGFCSDGENFYVALLSKGVLKGDLAYTDQFCKLLKIDMKTKKVVSQRLLGKVGHANSLTYNKKSDKIFIAPCTKAMPYSYSIDRNLNNLNKESLKDKKGNQKNSLRLVTLSYDNASDTYVTKSNDNKISFYDSNLILKNSVDLNSSLKINGKTSQQAISFNNSSIYSVCSDLKSKPTVNYILQYDLNGKLISKTSFKSGKERLEFEQLACVNNEYYILANVPGGKFRIYKLMLDK